MFRGHAFWPVSYDMRMLIDIAVKMYGYINISIWRYPYHTGDRSVYFPVIQ